MAITQKLLQSRLEYKNGKIFWRDGYRAGMEAGRWHNQVHRKYTYREVGIDRVVIPVARAIWIMHHGNIGSGLIVDHINRNTSDNRIENLRLASHALNMFNRNLQRNNNSGYSGLCYHKRSKTWRLYIGKRTSPFFYGSYKDKCSALRVWKEKRDEYWKYLTESK